MSLAELFYAKNPRRKFWSRFRRRSKRQRSSPITRHSSRFLLEQLEPRILLSGTPVVVENLILEQAAATNTQSATTVHIEGLNGSGQTGEMPILLSDGGMFSFTGKTGDVIEVNLGTMFAGIGTKFSELQFDGLTPLSDAQAEVPTISESGDWFLKDFVTVGPEPQGSDRIVGEVIFSDEVSDPTNPGSFDKTGLFYFAPGTTYALDSDPSIGFQGTINGSISVDDMLQHFTIQVDSGFSSTGTGVVTTGKLPLDTLRQEQRLRYLGFPDSSGTLVKVTTSNDKIYRWAAGLFNRVIADQEFNGNSKFTLQPGEEISTFINDPQAPRWTEVIDSLPAANADGQSGNGFQIFRGDQQTERWATSWASELLQAAAADWVQDREAVWPDLLLTAASLKQGGDTTEHQTHESGRDLDFDIAGSLESLFVNTVITGSNLPDKITFGENENVTFKVTLNGGQKKTVVADTAGQTLTRSQLAAAINTALNQQGFASSLKVGNIEDKNPNWADNVLKAQLSGNRMAFQAPGGTGNGAPSTLTIAADEGSVAVLRLGLPISQTMNGAINKPYFATIPNPATGIVYVAHKNGGVIVQTAGGFAQGNTDLPGFDWTTAVKAIEAWDSPTVTTETTKALLNGIKASLASASGYDLDRVRREITIFSNYLQTKRTPSGIGITRILFNDPRTWDIPGVDFAKGHNGHFHVDIGQPQKASSSGGSPFLPLRLLQELIEGATGVADFAGKVEDAPGLAQDVAVIDEKPKEFIGLKQGIEDNLVTPLQAYASSTSVPTVEGIAALLESQEGVVDGSVKTTSNDTEITFDLTLSPDEYDITTFAHLRRA